MISPYPARWYRWKRRRPPWATRRHRLGRASHVARGGRSRRARTAGSRIRLAGGGRGGDTRSKTPVETTEADIEEEVEMDETLDDAAWIEEQEEETPTSPTSSAAT